MAVLSWLFGFCKSCNYPCVCSKTKEGMLLYYCSNKDCKNHEGSTVNKESELDFVDFKKCKNSAHLYESYTVEE